MDSKSAVAMQLENMRGKVHKLYGGSRGNGKSAFSTISTAAALRFFQGEEYRNPEGYDEPASYGQDLEVNGCSDFQMYGKDGGLVSSRSMRIPIQVHAQQGLEQGSEQKS